MSLSVILLYGCGDEGSSKVEKLKPPKEEQPKEEQPKTTGLSDEEIDSIANLVIELNDLDTLILVASVPADGIDCRAKGTLTRTLCLPNIGDQDIARLAEAIINKLCGCFAPCVLEVKTKIRPTGNTCIDTKHIKGNKGSGKILIGREYLIRWELECKL